MKDKELNMFIKSYLRKNKIKRILLDVIINVNALVSTAPISIPGQDLIIYMPYNLYNLYIAALRTSNLYHYNGSDYTTFVPGTSIKVVATKGLNGSNKMYLINIPCVRSYRMNKIKKIFKNN